MTDQLQPSTGQRYVDAGFRFVFISLAAFGVLIALAHLCSSSPVSNLGPLAGAFIVYAPPIIASFSVGFRFFDWRSRLARPRFTVKDTLFATTLFCLALGCHRLAPLTEGLSDFAVIPLICAGIGSLFQSSLTGAMFGVGVMVVLFLQVLCLFTIFTPIRS